MMDERQIKKSNSLFPKMFRTFTLYIFSTLLVFFGYVQLFGDVKPNIIQLPTDSSDAEEDSFFGSFVQNMMNFKNIDTDVTLSFSNADKTTNLSLSGNVVYAQNGIALDVDLIYNQQTFDVKATYNNSNLFLTLAENTYKFDSNSVSDLGDGNVDFVGMLKFLTQVLDIDLSFIDELGDFLGIDFKNFNPNDLLSMLKIDENQLDNGGYAFKIKLGGSIEANVVCDENFNIVSAKTNDILIKNNELQFSAKVHKMNNVDVSTGQETNVEVSYDENGNEIDLTGLGLYAGYAKNLFENNQFVTADVALDLKGKQIYGKLFVDTAESEKVKFSTSVDGLDFEVAYANKEIFLTIGNVKIKMSAKEFVVWKEKINQLIQSHAGTTVSEFLKNILSNFVVEDENFDFNQILKKVLGVIFGNNQNLGVYLPNNSILNENAYTLIWQNNAQLMLTKNENTLESILASHGQNSCAINFVIAESGFVIEDQHFDVTNLMPVFDVVDEILKTNQAGGKISVEVDGNIVDCEYVVDFKDKMLAQIKTFAFGEQISIFVTNEEVLLQIGEIVVSEKFDNLPNSIEKFEQIFDVKINSNKPAMQEIFAIVKEIVNNVKLDGGENLLAFVQYLDGWGSLAVENKVAYIHFESAVCGDFTLGATNVYVNLPQQSEEIDTVLNKIEVLKNYVQTKQFAFAFELTYNQINLSGNAQIDLQNEIFEISGLMLGGHELCLHFEDDVVYVSYADIKLKASNVSEFANIILCLVNANLGAYETMPIQETQKVDALQSLLLEIFGENISKLSIQQILNKLSFNLVGTTDHLKFNVTFESVKPVFANVEVDFEQNMLHSFNIEVQQKVFANVSIQEFSLSSWTQQQKDEYYDLLSSQNGTFTVSYLYEENGEKKQIEIVADLQLDFSNGLYTKLHTTIFGEDFEILLIDNMMYVSIGEIVVCSDLCNLKDLIEKVIQIFDLQIENQFDLNSIFQILETLNLNEIDILQWLKQQNVDLQVSNQQISILAKISENLKVSVCLENKSFEKIEAPQNAEDLQVLLPKVKNLIDYAQKGIYEFNFALTYNNWEVVSQTDGTFKFHKGEFEVVCQNIFGEKLSVRLHNGTVYVAYGNVKIKFDLQSTGNQQIDIFQQINNLASGKFGFVVDFGVFSEIIEILQTYSLQDIFNKIMLDIYGTVEEICLKVSNKQSTMLSEILNAKMSFAEDEISKITLGVYDNVFAQIDIIQTNTSTIKDFVEEDYADFVEDYADGLMDSLQVQENVYAFASDIAIRYSNNTFYGNLTAMFVRQETQDENGTLKEVYMPAISFSTTSLGLSIYVYLIDQTVYVDVNGLQIKADLNESSINEIVDFVQENFAGIIGNVNSLQNEKEMLQNTASAFKVIIPALDRIYGKWVSCLVDGQTVSGIQIELGNTVAREDIVVLENIYNQETGELQVVETYSDDINDYGGESNVLKYAENAWFYNIVLQAFISNHQNTIIPNKVILGANIHDKNTVVYENYDEYLLDCEESVTKNLNFAVYLTNISVGEYVNNLQNIFVSDPTYQEIRAVKTNVSDLSYENLGETVTDLKDFNSCKTLLEVAKATYDYALGMEYQLSIDGSISNASSTTSLSGNLAVQVKDLPAGETNKTGIDLFNGKELNLQANLNVQQAQTNGAVDARHLIDLFYESNGFGLFASYTHSNYADGTELTDNIESGDTFKAKVSNSNLSEILSMALAFANVNLGEALTSALSLPQNKTDFTFIRDILGLNKQTDVSDTVSKVDSLLSSVENITKMIKQLSLKVDENSNVLLTLKLDLQANDKELAGKDIAFVQLVFEAVSIDEKVSYKLSTVKMENVVMGENTINMNINFGNFDEATSFDYDTSATHLDLSDISSFVDVAISTLNTKGINFKGNTTIGLPMFTDIALGFDLFVGLDENKELYVYLELDVGKSRETTWTAIKGNDKFTTYNVVLSKQPWSKRISTLEYKSGVLNIVNTTYDSRSTDFSSPKNVVKTYTYQANEIGSNIMQIMAQAVGMTNTVYEAIKYAITKIEAHPTIERAILDFTHDTTTSAYSLTINAENLMGMSGIQNMTITIGASNGFEGVVDNKTLGTYSKTFKFIDNVSTKLVIGNDIISVPVTLRSVENETSYVTADGKTLFTNNHWRNQYINSIGSLA